MIPQGGQRRPQFVFDTRAAKKGWKAPAREEDGSLPGKPAGGGERLAAFGCFLTQLHSLATSLFKSQLAWEDARAAACRNNKDRPMTEYLPLVKHVLSVI